MNKKNVAILFGGYSPEHEVSIATAANIISYMPEEKYNIIPVYITREGKWLMYDGHIDNIKNLHWERLGVQAFFTPDRVMRGLCRIVGDKVKLIPVDVVFPALHGRYGEDGTVQGLFEMSGIPYVGGGVLASAVSMDKEYMKIVAKNLNMNQARYVVLTRHDLNKIPKMGYPMFVKPANGGSSVGVSKAKNKKELDMAIEAAFVYDSRIIIEKAVPGREFECSVLGSGKRDARASGIGEVIPGGEFYDYDSKYNDNGTRLIVKADIPEETENEMRGLAVKIFNGVNGSGLARVDFFICENTGEIVFNEINTMPGFTSVSMYPRLWESAGIQGPELIDTLIELAFIRKIES